METKKQSIGVSIIIIIAVVGIGTYLLIRAKNMPVAPVQNATVPADTSNTPAPTTAPANMEVGKTYTQADGLQITITKAGTGTVAKAGDTVSVNYVGTLEDGTKFDASADHGGPADFPIGVGQVIKGWDEGVVGMKVGESRKLVIPGALAYGPTGIPGTIPPNATLVFTIDLVAIK